jgi:hypothetical protein
VAGAVAELLAWCFHSPRRLAAVLVGLLAVLVGAGVAVNAVRSGPVQRPSSAVGVSGLSPDAGPAVQAALAFTRAWASKPASSTAEQWRQAVSPLATPELVRGLAVTDPGALPGGAPTGDPTIRFVSVSSALIEVPLSTGTRVLVTVVLVNGHWLASDVQPVQGDPGDAPGDAPGAGASASAG